MVPLFADKIFRKVIIPDTETLIVHSTHINDIVICIFVWPHASIFIQLIFSIALLEKPSRVCIARSTRATWGAWVRQRLAVSWPITGSSHWNRRHELTNAAEPTQLAVNALPGTASAKPAPDLPLLFSVVCAHWHEMTNDMWTVNLNTAFLCSRPTCTYEESYSISNSNGRKFLYNS